MKKLSSLPCVLTSILTQLTFIPLLLMFYLFSLGCSSGIPQNLGEETEGFSSKQSISKPPSQKQKDLVNDLPAGRNTIAIIYNPNNGGKYVFAGFGKKRIGLLEILPPGKSAESLLVDSISPLKVLRYLDPNVPDQVIKCLNEGVVEAGYVPYRSGTAGSFQSTANTTCTKKIDVPFLGTDGGNCGAGHPAINNILEWSWNYIQARDCHMNANLNCSGAPLGEQDYCSPYYERVATKSVGWSQLTASFYHPTNDGSCRAYGKVYACSGITLFRAFQRESLSGEWHEALNYWIEEGHPATWIMWTSSCNVDKVEKDDFRFRADSYGQHLYGYTFFSEAINDGACNACD